MSLELRPMITLQVRDASGNVMTEGSFYVGADVAIYKNCFRITSADDKTLKLMEERSSSEFPYSDPVRAAELLTGCIRGQEDEVRATLRKGDEKVRNKRVYAAEDQAVVVHLYG